MGVPMYYRPPISGMRIVNITGAIILFVDAVLAIILGIVLVLGLWDFTEGAILLAAAILAIICGVGVFLSWNPMFNILGPLGLISGAIFLIVVEDEAIIICAIGIAVASVSLILMVLGWKDMVARHDAMARGIHPAMAGYNGGMQGVGPPGHRGAAPPAALNLRK